MIKNIKLYKQLLRGNEYMVIATPESYDSKTQRILVSVNNKVVEAIYSPQTKNATAKLDVPSTNANHLLASQLSQNPDMRVKVFVYDFIKDRILEAKLQEFGLNVQTFDYQATDEMVGTAPVILGAFDLKVLAEKAKKEEGIVEDYFVKAWWTDENDLPINEALLNDTVKFHIETKGIPNNEIVFVTLYDDDRRVNLKEDGKNDKMKLVYSSNGKEVIFAKVKNNKVTLKLTLENFDSFLKKESDGTLEFFFACSYVNPKTKISYNKDLPINPKDYLKVKGMPKIIFVNGQWNIAYQLPFDWGEYVGPTKPKKPYWNSGFDNYTIEYLINQFSIDKKQILNNKVLSSEELEKKNYILYYDGSSKLAVDQSGADRFKSGYDFASANYTDIIKGLGNDAIYFVSHSEGGAYAAGMADFLFQKGHTIGEHILLSPDEADEFEINPAIPSYQLLYMFFSSVWNPTATIANIEKSKLFNKIFRLWGTYYAIVDWVVNEYKIKGITKMGIAHIQDSGWTGVHGWTNGTDVFQKVVDLKEVTTFEAIGEYDDKVYSGKQQSETTNKTKFYRINDEYIVFNCPPILKIK
ncbi:hypothetical protein EZL74_11110 [Flavobacterium silvisoli]|uniref:Uncharacterized protein n=1 Tax=Flavobacterium silvisoli TaxID=2529433 RepID=A0A4Q9YRE4_9FLAO|nr:hypothetical protein [Flavobacterium silvisoli]TBX66130.1 hypothetical protein EZL74_11110 [Flavobacterium silvisoli]